MSTEFDVIVIGAGPGGYVAAIRCAQLGLKTACVDEWVDPEGKSSPGGTCLNVGCIPSKAMIESSELYEKAQHDYAVHGINIKDVSLNLETLLARKNKVVSELTSGIAALFVANKIGFFHGRGVLKKSKTVDVALNNGETQQLTGSNIIIATGSSPAELKIAPFDHETIVDSTDALSFDKVPEKLGVIGAGVIALELGSVWRRLGSDVTMFKSRDNFLPTADKQIGAEALKQFKAQGLKFSMGVKILKTEIQKNKVSLIYEEKGTQKTATFDKLIVAVGRYPNSRGVFDEDVGIKLNDKGLIDVDEFGKTSVAGIYAIGDVVRGPMLAHKASEEGVSVAEKIAGHTVLPVNLETVPSVIYTTPEIAWVGKTEQALEEAGVKYKTGSFPFNANGRARAMNETNGFVKVLADEKTDRILGVHMIGPQSAELIMQAKIAMDFGSSSEDLAMTMFAHPTLSETLHEAALSVDGRAIHAVQMKRK